MNIYEFLGNYLSGFLEFFAELSTLKKILVILFGSVYFVIWSLSPSKEELLKNEQILYDTLPKIYNYESKLLLKENVELSTIGITAGAEAFFLEKGTEEEILNYYEKELSKFGWEKFVLKDEQHFYRPARRKRKGYKNFNYSNDIEVWMYFDNIKNENEKTYYEISFYRQFRRF